jgi:stringent starvation protein B
VASTKPYLIRAIHEWCTDQGFTPYLAVVVDAHTRVPREFVQDGQIVLNVGLDATGQLQLGNEEISFQARFNGVAFPVHVPIRAVAAIYARENGQGMAFEPEAAESADTTTVAVTEVLTDGGKPEKKPPTGGGRPRLTRVK